MNASPPAGSRSIESARPPHFVPPQTLMEDPHAKLAALRDDHAVIQIGARQYMALRAADGLALLTDPCVRQIEGADYVRLNQIPDGAAARFLTDFFLFANGDAHRTMRRLFARAFSHNAMRQAQPQVRAVADAIVDALPRNESFDFVAGMAARVPAEMIASILGLPAEDAPRFASLVHTMAEAIASVYPQHRHDRIEAATVALQIYVADHLQTRLKQPRGDLLSTLVADWQASLPMPFDSLVIQVLGIIIGGTDTTRTAFAMLVALLLRHPEQWAAVKADPALIPGAVAEGLRYEPSVGSFARFTTAPVTIGDSLVPADAMLRVSTMAVLRDPAVYADPERFDIRRTDHPRMHPVFGGGPHRCLGDMLARIEMQEALAALIAAAPEIELVEQPRMRGFGGIRQITPMQIRILDNRSGSNRTDLVSPARAA